MVKKILLSLTTVSQGQWRNKVKEIDELGLKEIALFPTCLNFNEREELYQLLEKTGLERIPHVHLRNDMECRELDYLTAKFRTEVFNIHSENSSYPFRNDCQNYNKIIFVENLSGSLPTTDELNKYGGWCLDLSHLEAVALEKGEGSREAREIKQLAAKFKIGVNHISAIKADKISDYDRFLGKTSESHDSHWLSDLSEVDYVKKYKNYLADIISLELENSLKRQLEVKNYLEKILDL